jgi:FMN phosphatase YigB (HAD superfamily)
MEQVVGRVLAATGATSTPDRLLVVGSRWDPDLAVPHAAGCTTALVDRFGRGRGTPTWRGAQLAELVADIHRWVAASGTVRG